MKPVDVTLFLCGDVMLGRGVDQIQRYRSDPRLYEGHMTSAVGYVELAEQVSGPIPRGVAPDYVWGDALAELARVRPAARIVNLETAVTISAEPWHGKGIHYRMHPDNVGVLAAAGIDCCVLANNHVLDWSRPGLIETLATLQAAGIRTAGAGRDAGEATAPAILPVGDGARVLLFACATLDCGTEPAWAATATRAGITLLSSLAPAEADAMAARVRSVRRPGDIVIVSIHWGGNWGYEIPPAQRRFAHALIDAANVDIVHGHSSHHPKGIEVHRGRLILYGCGDFINDYEGIGGHEEFGAGLALMYFATVDAASGRLVRLAMTPTRMRRLRVERTSPADARWLTATLERECRRLGGHVEGKADGQLQLVF